ncbi:MAG: molybdenum cofactor guanylyltransferase [Gemmataceae bacterium]
MSNLGKTGGIVLCGGMSRRMGTAKAWLPIQGETMLARICRILAQVVDPIVVVAGPNQDVPPLPSEIEVVRDTEECQGPLKGLVGGLRALEGGADAAYLTSCDVPLLRSDFVKAVVDSLAEYDAAAPEVNGRLQPLAAVYRSMVRLQAEAMLAKEQRRARDLLDLVRTRRIPADELRGADPALESLRNINTPEEYEAVLRDVATLDRKEPRTK